MKKKRSRTARTSFVLNIVAAVGYAVSATAWVWLAIHDSSWAWIPASLFIVPSAGHSVLAHHMFKMIRVYRASEGLEERISRIYR
ncbi:MAG: hypothetical protein ACTH4Y_08375 [Microbacterium gubbeenense]|uniref:hypothetical protein n=1 Tax=Microbacterium gubbeenense TaxID=159896 RepID=UPI003F9943A1